MATTGVGFRWLDILEKEFDKACVELDTSLVELEAEEPEVAFTARQKIATLGSCFSQLTHKALTIFQNSAKMEAELVDIRAELVQARAASAGGCRESGDAAGNVTDLTRARAEAAQLARENAALRETVLALHSELFGARLATKYLDKELAGRIQQLQLLGRDMRSEVRDSLWAQVEAEILLQRHKTLVRVCRGVSPWPARPPPPRALSDGRARPRTVRVRRSPHLGLGISVTGGREHGVPILISELEAGGPAALTGQLYVGDAILAINDVDLTQACHKEAVQALQSVKGDCALCVQFIATDDDDRLSEDNYRFPLYPEDEVSREPDGSGATPTAPRTPDYDRRSDVDSPPPYPDYNSMNNNLNILDMDDDSIKIEASLEWDGAPSLVPLARYPGESPRSARSAHSALSALSARSTPVHARPLQPNKRRKPQDWRTKGAYRAVELEADEPRPEATHDITPESLDDTPPASPPSPEPTPLVAAADSPLKQPTPALPLATIPPWINPVTYPKSIPQVTLPPSIPQVTLPPSIPQVTLPPSIPQVTLPPSIPQVTLPPSIPQVTLPPSIPQVTLPPSIPQVTLPPSIPQVTLPPSIPQVTLPPSIPQVTLPPSIPQVTLPPSIPQVTLPPSIPQVTLPPSIPQVTLPPSIPQVTLPPSIPQVTLPPSIPQAPLPPTTVPSTLPQVTLPQVQPSKTFAMAPTMLNGDAKPAKREKGFRIGSARRVVEGAVNGATRGHLLSHAHAPHAHAHAHAPRLRAGDGDPDFGTPV